MSLLSLYIISKIPVIKGVFLAGGIVGGLIAAIGYIEYLGSKDKYPRLVVVDDFASDAKYKMSYIIDELKKKIIWCVEHPDEIKEMGSRSYEIYRNVFSMETFETNLLKYAMIIN